MNAGPSKAIWLYVVLVDTQRPYDAVGYATIAHRFS